MKINFGLYKVRPKNQFPWSDLSLETILEKLLLIIDYLENGESYEVKNHELLVVHAPQTYLGS